MATLRLQMTQLQTKKFGLFFFPTDNSLEPAKTSLVKHGAVVKDNMVRLYWDKKNPDIPAKIVYLADTLEELERKRHEITVGNEINVTMTTSDKVFFDNWAQDQQKTGGNKQKRKKMVEGCEPAKKSSKITESSHDTDREAPVNKAETEPNTTTITSTTCSSTPAINPPTVETISLTPLQPATISNILSINLPLDSSPLQGTSLITPFPNLLNSNSSENSFSSNLVPGSAGTHTEPTSFHCTSNFQNIDQFPNSTVPLSPILPERFSSTFIDENTTTSQQTNYVLDELCAYKISEIETKVDKILLNQEIIMNKLGIELSNAFDDVASSSNVTNFSTMTLQSPNTDTQHNHDKTFSLEQLQVLNKTKRKNTTNAYFAVILLRELTSPEERVNCTVYGEGKKSKGLHTKTLAKIKEYYTTLYEEESWNDAVTAMNNHLRKYCSSTAGSTKQE